MCFCSESSFTHGSLLCLALNLENAESHCHKHADRAERTQEARVRGGRGGRAARDPQRNGHQVRGVAVQAEAVRQPDAPGPPRRLRRAHAQADRAPVRRLRAARPRVLLRPRRRRAQDHSQLLGDRRGARERPLLRGLPPQGVRVLDAGREEAQAVLQVALPGAL